MRAARGITVVMSAEQLGQQRRRGLALPDEPAHPALPDRARRRGPGLLGHLPARGGVGRAVAGQGGARRAGRHRGDDPGGRGAVRALPLGPLRHHRAAALVSRSAAWRTRASPSPRPPSWRATSRWSPWSPTSSPTPGRATWSPTPPGATSGSTRASPATSSSGSWSSVFGPERSRLEKQLARDELERELADLEPWQQVLHVDLERPAPRRGLLRRPLREGLALPAAARAGLRPGRLRPFLRGWFDAHAFRSVTTADLVSWIKQKLFPSDSGQGGQHRPRRPGWNSRACPATRPARPAWRSARWTWSAQRFLSGTPAGRLDTKGWVTQQWQHLIKTLPADLPLARMAELDAAFRFTRSGNSEILSDWLLLAIKRRYTAGR